MENVTRHDATKNIWNGSNFVSCLPKNYKGVEIPCYFIHNGLRLPGNSPLIIDANFDEIYQGEAYFEVTKVYPTALQIAKEAGIVDEAIKFANLYLSSIIKFEFLLLLDFRIFLKFSLTYTAKVKKMLIVSKFFTDYFLYFFP